ncbi:MAG: dTDP-4-dehydrorhamnose reductase [Paludibacteraceae bacterium]|jgi:dTDP-4-dehydrorhamnose reductase|nr:dTDP-4-dehydrorhamnose reductase [Paludibacteraceae bacterium]
MKNILVTGAYGQLGNEVRLLSANYPQYNFMFTDVDSLDICDKAMLLDFVQGNDIRYIINCAAYTAVDKAEDDAELCEKINAKAVKNLGEVAQEVGAGIIHVSTDYVFNGKGYMPYTEDMPTSPCSVYGKTKLKGEKALLKACEKAMVVRTAWLYSPFGNNFVKTMRKLGAEREQLNVIFDQIGTPTYAEDLAAALLVMMDKTIDQEHNKGGVYHYSNEGVCSWYDFTLKIHQLSGITTCQVNPIETKDYPTKAARPHYSVLNKAKIKATFGVQVPHWESSLQRCIEELNNQQED